MVISMLCDLDYRLKTPQHGLPEYFAEVFVNHVESQQFKFVHHRALLDIVKFHNDRFIFWICKGDLRCFATAPYVQLILLFSYCILLYSIYNEPVVLSAALPLYLLKAELLLNISLRSFGILDSFSCLTVPPPFPPLKPRQIEVLSSASYSPLLQYPCHSKSIDRQQRNCFSLFTLLFKPLSVMRKNS